MIGYKLLRLGEIGNIITGNTPSKKRKEYYASNDIKFIKPNNFIPGKITNLIEANEFLSKMGSKVGRKVSKGTVLVTCIGTIGNVGIAGEDICFNQQINAIEANSEIVDNRYLAYSILYRKDILKAIANAPVVPIINKTQFSKIEISLPPLEIQKKIVETLDRAQELIDLRKKQILLLDDLVQSIFYDMFGDPITNPKEWEIGTIKDLTYKTQYGSSKKAKESTGDFPIIRMNNITYSGGWDFTNLKYINLDKKEQTKYLVHKGELLFNRTNSKELVGKTAVYREEKAMAFAGYLVKLKTNSNANSEYISAYLNSKHGKLVLLNMAKSIVGMANINAEELKKIKILKPPVKSQNQFAEKAQKIEEQKKLMQKSLVEMENNFNNLMQRAFKGELFLGGD